MKITKVLLILLFTTSVALSQRQETIDSDRPGQSLSPHTVGKNVLQVQSGIDYSSNSDNPLYTYNIIGNETNIRYGLSKIFEINGTIGYRVYNTDYTDDRIEDRSQHGAELLRIGTRVNLLDHDGLTPAIAVSAEVIIPFETDVYNFIDYGFRGMVILKQPITDDLALTGNIGIFDNPAVPVFFYPYTLNASYSFSNDFSAFVEVYGLLIEDYISFGQDIEDELNYDAGVGYLLNNDFLFDFSIGKVSNFGGDSWYVNAGVSFRFGGNE